MGLANRQGRKNTECHTIEYSSCDMDLFVTWTIYFQWLFLGTLCQVFGWIKIKRSFTTLYFVCNTLNSFYCMVFLIALPSVLYNAGFV